MIVNGKFTEVCWQNTLTPERAAAIERDYQANRREERRRIDARFAPRTDAERRSQKFSAPPKHSRAEIEQLADRLIAAMERLAAGRDRRNQMLRILEF
jgi:hypothetical protein